MLNRFRGWLRRLLRRDGPVMPWPEEPTLSGCMDIRTRPMPADAVILGYDGCFHLLCDGTLVIFDGGREVCRLPWAKIAGLANTFATEGEGRAGQQVEAVKYGQVIPWSQELTDDYDAAEEDFRSVIRFHRAIAEGRVVYRGGGWWRLDGVMVRGRRAVVRLLDTETEEG